MRERDRHRGIRKMFSDHGSLQRKRVDQSQKLEAVATWMDKHTVFLLGGPQYSLKRSSQRNTSQVSTGMQYGGRAGG